MFGDTLHLHRSSANAKQIRRAIGSNNIPPPALPAPVPTPSLPYHKTGMTQSHSTNFQGKSDTSTFQSPYSQPTTIKTSSSSYNFTTPSSGPYSTHPQPSRSDRPAAVTPLPLHLQTKGGKIGGPVGNVSLHSSNDSGFSNDPPPQPEIDYSDDESISGGGQTKIPPRNNKHRRITSDNNNNNTKKMHSIRPSNSSSNLMDRRFYMSDDQDTLSTISPDRKGIVKRTKSFWKFGKSSDNDILEGMALWKHKDLVDIKNIEKKENEMKHKQHNRSKKSSRDRSNDSDKTLNAKHYNDDQEKIKPVRSKHSFSEKQKVPPQRKEIKIEKIEDYDDDYEKSTIRNNDDQFYEDSGDGLVLKTVNRKDILQQYTNDSSVPDSDSESESTSDDPYDCILVDDQTHKVRKGEDQFTSVAAIGKKLEKLSKSSKYSPQKNTESNRRTLIEKNNNMNMRNERKNNDINNSTMDHDDIMQYRDGRQSFKTFGIETPNSENGENERPENDRYYPQTRKRNNEAANGSEKRRYYSETNGHSNSTDRRNRQSYDSIDSEIDAGDNRTITNNRRNNMETEKKEKLKYYTERQRDGEFSSDANENRQFLPRTKLTKTNSNNSNSRQEPPQQDGSEYGDTLQRRMKTTEYTNMYDEKLPHSGNMYGPWYDLWGLDASDK
ncbi:hypothetical protein QE152_g7118 [Popillia japonica]|uniref:Uncharacterized protein n=1 Tax=Popillia japonica TaxID=7064 RepID=A0AAW1MCL7_POPJA